MKFRVNASNGWPLENPARMFGEEFESDAAEDAAAVDRGYLIALDEPKPAKVKRGAAPDVPIDITPPDDAK